MEKVYHSYSIKAPALTKIASDSTLQLFALDTSSSGGSKYYIASNKYTIFKAIYHKNLTLKTDCNFYYDYIEHDSEVSLVIDLDIKNLDGTLHAAYDCGPYVLQIVSQVNAFINDSMKLHLTIADWIITTAGYYSEEGKTPKHSYHAKLTRYKFANVLEIKDLFTVMELDDPLKSFDTSIYRAGAFRLTGCTKKGRNLPLVPVHLYIHGASTRVPEDYENFYEYWCDSMMTHTRGYQLIALPDRLKPTPTDRLTHKNPEIRDIEIVERVNAGELPDPEVITGLLKCLSVERATAYQDWYGVCQATARSCKQDTERIIYEAFVEFSKKCSAKYDTNYVATQWENCKKSVMGCKPLMCGSLFRWAKLDNPQEYAYVRDTLHLPRKLLAEFLPDYSKFPRVVKVDTVFGPKFHRTRPLVDEDDIFDYYEYHSSRCEPFPYKQYPYFIAISGCGSGKSYQTVKMIQEAQFERMLKLSVRILYTKEVMSTYKAQGISLDSYLNKEKEVDLSGYPALIISPESCYRASWNRKYDFFDGDESESLLRSFSSEKTMHNLPGSAAALVDFLTQARHVSLADAHISNRTLDMLRMIYKNTNKRFLIMRNTMQTCNRTVRHYVQQSKSPSLIEKYQDYYIDLIIADIKGGKNVGVHSNSKGFADRLVMALDDEQVLKKDEYIYLYGDQGIEGDIESLDAAFEGKRAAIWTPAVTVGNSCNLKIFHCQYSYLTCKSTNAAVAVQACQRIRHLKDDTLHIMVDDVPNQCCKLTFDDVRQSLEDKREEIVNCYRTEMERRAAMTRDELLEVQERTKGDAVACMELINRILDEKMKSPALYTPEVLFNTLVWNALEDNLSMMHYNAMLYHYLKGEGYTKIERVPVVLKTKQDSVPDPDGNPPIKRRGKRDCPRLMFNEIADLTEEQFHEIDRLKRKGQHTQEQLAALEKYLFVKRLIKNAPVSEEDQAALFDDYRVNRNHKEWLFYAYNACKRDASDVMLKDIAKTRYLEVVRVDGAVQHHMDAVCDLLGLKNIHDTTSTFDRDDIEKNMVPLEEHLKALRILLKKEAKKTDFRSVTDTLKTIFKELYGIKLENRSKGKLERSKIDTQPGALQKQVVFGLDYADSFAMLLYTCGLL